MSKRAQERALEFFPVKKIPYYGLASGRDVNLDKRILFCIGYEQAEKDFGWVSVKERLPGPSEWVVACVEVDGICTCLTLATYDEETKEWHTDSWEDGEQEFYHPDYWMPIPNKI